ncbi:FecCD family ABC transporter permease [Roseateles toxinivorans]|uniref:Iron complex transport system permease protein n=1 Tax=Roseateles toxinivorans TaxID=270368 RepID=A0A4R6QMT1_9BURK|nr:iron ABC transporter permease [Roseateles toxinivorans]TDP71192.1 iron complex transport system permease protein [Roseateles toxinivorans]
MISRPGPLLALLLLLTASLAVLGVAVGSTGFAFNWIHDDQGMARQILWQIRLPRSLGAWTAGALLGLAGAIAQGLFRNPLADPYLLGSASGAGLGVALALAFIGMSPASSLWLDRLGLTGVAFVGTVAGVLATLLLARGVEHTLRLLLAGVVVGVVLTAATNLIMLNSPEIMRSMQAFMLGTTGLLGWNSVILMAIALALCLLVALGGSRALDALTLGEATAHSLGVRLGLVRVVMIGAFALGTGTAVAQAGMIAFVGLVAPHLVRNHCPTTHGKLLLLSACAGGVLLLAADILARWMFAPQELPVGIITAILGGSYLLWLMHRRTGRRPA